ncbi:2-oxoglutarate-dependent dioxygenase DAO-like [Cryptomeria japonica]|uniref:2-oxoglutarate-dependent dioxygenase DAO-like n=1 Tax=Cryptomeria japonica TaxID=3369 RepID=UPI0025ACB266|nr:2-oxoglutarate-dependent dioxygenase DAO-like [Cryptomeria japonica]
MPSVVMTGEYMKSEQVPVIDLSSLKNGHEAESATLAKVKKACQEWGCFLVVNHGIEENVITQMDSATRETFKVSKENKEKIQGEFGYIPSMAALPFLEILPVNGAPDPNAIQKFAQELWPQGNPKICKVIEAYSSGVEELTNDIIKAIFKSFGVSKYYKSQFWGLLRMNHCDVRGEARGGLGPHTDHNLITVMYQDNTGGLELKTKAGNWVEVKPMPNSFVVFTGDSLKAWSNARIHSGIHRVIVNNKSPRVSLPYFFFFPDDDVIEAPPEFVDEEHPCLYSPFKYGDYKSYCKAIKSSRCEHKEFFERESDEAFLENFLAASSV